MRPLITPLATAVLIFALFFLYGKIGPGIPLNMISTQKTDLFTVTGEGKITAIPDTAKITVGFTIDKPDIKSAYTQANQTINQLTDAFTKLGIKKEDIKTVNYTINPKYDYSVQPAKTSGFTVSINQEITVTNLDLINNVIDTAASQGANLVGGLQFTVNDQKLRVLQQEARKKAISDAKSKAQQMAQDAGITLGKVININEAPNQIPVPMYSKVASGGLGGGVAEAAQVQPGTSEINSTVSLTFETR